MAVSTSNSQQGQQLAHHVAQPGGGVFQLDRNFLRETERLLSLVRETGQILHFEEVGVCCRLRVHIHHDDRGGAVDDENNFSKTMNTAGAGAVGHQLEVNDDEKQKMPRTKSGEEISGHHGSTSCYSLCARQDRSPAMWR